MSPTSRGPVGAPTSSRCMPTTIAPQTMKNTNEGRSRRIARLRTNEPSLSPRRRAASSDTRFEKPPTKKKIGITCSTQVASQSQDVTPIALVVRSTPSCHHTIPIVQCPTTTAQMLAARRKSTTRSREAGVASAKVSREAALMRMRYPLDGAGSSAREPPDWQDGRMGRRWRIVLGVVLVLAGLCATIAGLAIALLVGTDGSIGLPPTRIVAAGTAITLPQLDVPDAAAAGLRGTGRHAGAERAADVHRRRPVGDGRRVPPERPDRRDRADRLAGRRPHDPDRRLRDPRTARPTRPSG